MGRGVGRLLAPATPDVMHLGRATPDPKTGTLTFEAWPYPLEQPE